MKPRLSLIAFLITLLLALSIALSGCGGSKPVTTTPPSQPAAQTQQDQSQTGQPSDKSAVSQPQSQQQTETKASTPTQQTTTAPDVTSTPAPQTQNKEVTVYITKTGEKYHRDGCRYLSKSKIPISLSNAKTQGYGPCSVCGPPQ